MKRNFCPIVLAAVFLVQSGCSDYKTATIDESDLDVATAAPDESVDTFAGMDYLQEPEEESPLEFLAFWKWFEDDEDDEYEPVEFDDVLSDMSPELVNISETEDEPRIRRARVYDTNTRLLWRDLERFLLLERPSRLSEFPIR